MRKPKYIKKVRSSSGSHYYKVTVYGPRTATCECLGYQYRQHCKHITRTLNNYAA